MTSLPPLAREWRRKSQLAFGICAICVLFLLETWNAHQQMPHAASPYIWAALGVVAAAALVAALWCRRQAARAAQDGPAG